MSVKNTDCCGCSACAVVCPKNAVKMGFDSNGFYTSSVDDDTCINCGLCEKVCPVITNEAPAISKENVFIAVSRDKSVLERSSSGGIGYVFAKKALQNDMPVCAVTYNAEKKCAEHIVVEESDELYRTQGSKYLQSSSYEGFENIVGRGKGIVFGTPCQIAGLNKLLKIKNIRDKYILADIFCHGVPSRLLWTQNLKWLEEKNKADASDNAVFRQKKHLYLTVGKYNAWYNEDAFYTFFLRGWLNCHRCYSCSLRRNSDADIRIGDCMVSKYDSLYFSPSTIIANTEKGMDFLNSCKDEIEFYRDDYSVVDGVQEKENRAVPENYDATLNRLRNGEYPEQIIKNVMIKGRIKSFIKHDILFKIKKRDNCSDLKSLV